MQESEKVEICERNFDEDFEDQGLLASVNPEDFDEIQRLLNLVDRRLHNAVEEEDTTAIRNLLHVGAFLTAFDWAGRTPLHLCIVKKLIKPFEILLRYTHTYSSLNAKDASGLSVLQVAVLHRWVEGVRAVLEAGADVTDVNFSYIPESVVKRRYEYVNMLPFGARFSEETVIHLAVKSGDIEIIEVISSKAQMKRFIDCLNGKGVTPLYTAIEMGDLEAVKILLKKGASVNTVSDLNDTALHIAVRQPNILKYLLENTEVVNDQNDYGSGPIHIAVSCNELESVKLLLDANHVLKRNYKKSNIRKRLIKPGTNKNNASSLFHCPPKKWEKVFAFILCMPEPVGYWSQSCFSKSDKYRLREYPVIQSDDNGYTPLHIAAKQRNLTMMILLLRKGAKLLSKGPKGRSALEVVASEFHNPTECFELIFDEFINTRRVLNDTVVDVDYRALKHFDKVSQIKVLEELVK